MIDLHDIDDEPITGLTKGMPGGMAPIRLGDIGRQGWNVLREDLPLPLAVLKQSALDHNADWMSRFLALSGAVMAPHGKTTMSPQLFATQLAHGAWGITLATVQQVQVARRFGVSRIVLANQLVGRQAIRYVLDELHRDPAFELYCLVDSVEGVRLLADALARHPLARPLPVLLEGGAAGERTGCRDLPAAMAVARAVAAEPRLALRGVEGFEGLIHAPDLPAQERAVTAFLGFLKTIAATCAAEGLFAPGPVILSAGGSAFYDMVVDGFRDASLGRELILLTRSGCYLTHDSAMYRRLFARLVERTPVAAGLGGGLRPALEVWAYVQSRPEPGKAILTAGKRDLSHDADMPVPLLWYRPGRHEAPVAVGDGCRIAELNDQHAHLLLPADSPLAVGDMVALGVSHPCTTFDKWQVICVVDDRYDVVSAVRTYF